MINDDQYKKLRKFTCKLIDDMDQGTMDPRAVADMALQYMSEDDVKAMCLDNDLHVGEEDEIENPVKASYTDGECPDCGESIPDDVTNGDECANCGHTFTHERDAE